MNFFFNKILSQTQLPFTLFFLLIANLLVAQKDWELQKSENGISVYTKDQVGSNFKEIKATTNFKHSLSELIGLLTDISSHTLWIYNCKQSKLIKEVSPSEVYYYMETSVPWPASNRDGVLCFKFTQDKETKIVTVASHGVPDILPEIDGVVRVHKLVASWKFIPKADGSVDAEYQINVDPGGSVPAWIVNMFSVEGPYESLTDMKKLLAEDKYKSSKFDFISN
jgi:hypothetical protein